MKPILIRTPPQHKILKEQSQKLKEKLESLKKQIQTKKKEKQKQKFGQHQQKLAHSRNSNTNFQISEELSVLLAILKMQNLATKLKEKRVCTVEQFNSIKEEELESWKEIAIGYRIKIKKYLSSQQSNMSDSRKKLLLTSPEKVEPSKLNIEDIIKSRKEGQKYIPLSHKGLQPQIFQQKQLQEQQQEIMIKSLKTVFNFHPKKQPSSALKKEQGFNSQEELEQIRYKKPIQRIKTPIPAQRLQNFQDLPDYKYCWACLKMIKHANFQYNSRQFCSQFCLQSYKETVEIQAQNDFFVNVQATQQKFQQHMYKRFMAQVEGGPKKEAKRRQLEVEELDLQIL